MKTYRSWLYLAILVWVLFIQCSSEHVDPSGGNKPTGTITSKERMDLLDACIEKITTLNNIAGIEDKVAFIAWLLEQPKFKTAGLSVDLNVYAVFVDGQVTTFATKPSDDIGGRSSGRSNNSMSSKGDESTARKMDIPESDTVLLLNAIGGTEYPDNTALLQNMFDKLDFKYKSKRELATVEELKHVKGVGIFYLQTYGGRLHFINSETGEEYATSYLMTYDLSSEYFSDFYEQDFEDGMLINYTQEDERGWSKRIGITEKFIQRYMTFAENAFIYIDGASTFPSADPSIIPVFFQKMHGGHGTYIGWERQPDPEVATKASLFIFDRLLGTNIDEHIPKEDPKQRPFDLFPVLEDLTRNKMDFDHRDAKLMYESTQLSAPLLRPSIEYMEIDEFSNSLIIHGVFGEKKGTVFVNDYEIFVLDWGSSYIRCDLPEIPYQGSQGDVVVVAHDYIKSNAVPISVYDISLNYKTNENGIIMEGDFSLILRADVHRHRDQPHVYPKRTEFPNYSPGSGYLFNRTSQGSYKIHGQKLESCTKNPCTVKYTEVPKVNSGSLPYNISNTGNVYISAIYNWRDDHTIELTSLNIVPPSTPVEWEQVFTCPKETRNKANFESNYGFGLPSLNFNYMLLLDVADNYTIRPGAFSKTISRPWADCSTTGTYTLTVHWEAITPRFPPDEDETLSRIGGN